MSETDQWQPDELGVNIRGLLTAFWAKPQYEVMMAGCLQEPSLAA
jgi:hypothetical protein